MSVLGIAHRGEWSQVPENTLAAFEAAERAGADMIELDVQRTRDGGVVVMHDDTLDRVWGVPGTVADMTLAELRAVDERIPELREVLAAFELPVMVDYKEKAGVLEPALAAVLAADALERVVWAGHNLDGHRQLHELEPAARIALSWEGVRPPSEALLTDLGVEWFNPAWDVVQPAVVDAMHERGLLVSTWTVDDRRTMADLLDVGVDAVITNRIGDFVALLDDRRAAAC